MGEGSLRFPLLPALMSLELRFLNCISEFQSLVLAGVWTHRSAQGRNLCVQVVTHTPVQLLGGTGCVITKIPFKPGIQDFPFQINQDQIPKHFISVSGFPNQTKQRSDLRERVSSLLFYPDLSTHHAWEPWWAGTETRKVTPADPHINVTC